MSITLHNNNNFLPNGCDYHEEQIVRKTWHVKIASEANMICCPNCGSVLPSNVKYCAFCGDGLKKVKI